MADICIDDRKILFIFHQHRYTIAKKQILCVTALSLMLGIDIVAADETPSSDTDNFSDSLEVSEVDDADADGDDHAGDGERDDDRPPPVINTSGADNTAIDGYDVVAYHVTNQAVAGQEEYAYQWKGIRWLFANADTRELFRDDPWAYLPEYGGYCAWAASNNYIAGIDPRAFAVVDDKLYLNFSKGINRRWSRDIPGNIAKGDKNWPKLQSQLQR